VHYTLFVGSEGLSATEPAWRALEERVAVHAYQTHTFARLWYETIGKRSKATPVVVTYEECGEVLGIFPACVLPYGPIKLLTWMGAPFVQDYGDILWDPSASISPQEFIAEAMRLVRTQSWSGFFYLTNVRHDAVAYPTLSENIIAYKRSAAPYIEIPDTFDRFLELLGSSGRAKNMRRLIRRTKRDSDVSFEVLDSRSPDADEVLEWLFEAQKARYRGSRGRSDLYRPGHEEFRRAQLREQPGILLSRLSLKDRTIAADMACLRNRRMYGMLTSFDTQAASYSPGHMLTAHIVEYCCNNGVEIYDQGWGEEAYKYYWTNRHVAMTTFVNDNLRGRVLKSIAGARRKLAQVRRGNARSTSDPTPPIPSDSDRE
jgi:CelD/BcsL family acetyltransferase involved in cellulose biosynthesis